MSAWPSWIWKLFLQCVYLSLPPYHIPCIVQVVTLEGYSQSFPSWGDSNAGGKFDTAIQRHNSHFKIAYSSWVLLDEKEIVPFVLTAGVSGGKSARKPTKYSAQCQTCAHLLVLLLWSGRLIARLAARTRHSELEKKRLNAIINRAAASSIALCHTQLNTWCNHDNY